MADLEKKLKRSLQKYCKKCFRIAHYSYTFDSKFCLECDIWLEDECNCSPEADCHFQGRTEKPSEAPYHPFDF